jgi:hypothetical protein
LIMNRYPAKQTADQLATYGRYGDSMLVHMHPDEVAGIASLMPNGQLTTNPVTGQPEAFGLKELLRYGLPIAASIAAPALLPAISPALAAGIGSGLATTAVTGDLERGLVSGVMGAGIGAATGAAGATAAEAAATQGAEALGTGMTNMASALGTAGTPEAMALAAQEATQGQIAAALADKTTQQIGTNMAASIGTAGTPEAMAQWARPKMSTFGERLVAPFQSDSNFWGEFIKPRTALPVMLGASQLAGMDAQDQWEEDAAELEEDREAKQKQAYNDLQGAYRAAQPNAAIGINPYRRHLSTNMPRPLYGGYAGGGQIKYDDYPNNFYNRGGNPGYGGIDPVTIQQGLRGKYSVPPPAGFTPGFSPEFNYFQNDPNNVVSPPITGPGFWTQRYANWPSSKVDPSGGSYFKSVIRSTPKKPEEMAEGGDVTLNLPEGPVGIAPGGIADINNLYTQQQPVPTEEDMQMLATALLGGTDQADKIINMFISKYGNEVFQIVRQMILQTSVPNAQTEGLVEGQGGGMDDQVMGMIGGQQPVAVSPGEYIVPADVVSGLGDGSSDAGAAELDTMANDVRMARQGGRIEQPAPIDARRMMPR